jgi:hypothetical protein
MRIVPLVCWGRYFPKGRCSVAISISFICITACITRWNPTVSEAHFDILVGTTCHETPNLSASQPHRTSSAIDRKFVRTETKALR